MYKMLRLTYKKTEVIQKMRKKILICGKVNLVGIDFLKAQGYDVKFSTKTDEDSLIADLADCEALLVRLAPITRKVLENCPNLKVIGKHGVGTDSLDLEAAKELGITVVNAPLANAVSVAEYTIALMMACARAIPMVAESYRQGDFNAKDLVVCNQMAGSTLGLIGYGHIGSLVANIASKGLGMNVVAYDPYIKAAPEGVSLIQAWNDIFKVSDYISVHMPLTKDTRHIISTNEFQLMKKTATIINCARGPIIDEEALIKALHSGEIKGAGLDVTEMEPCLPDNPLFTMNNVVITAHSGATTKEALDKMVMVAAEGIVDVLNNKQPKWLVA